MAKANFEQIPWINVGVGSVIQTKENDFYLVVDERYSYRISYSAVEGHTMIRDQVTTADIAQYDPAIAIYKPKRDRWFSETQLSTITSGSVDIGSYPINRDDMDIIFAEKVKVKQMTVAEIEKALGYKVEVISGKEH